MEIVEIKGTSSYFRWTTTPAVGVYLGESAYSIYGTHGNKTHGNVCYQIWSEGSIRTLTDKKEMRLVAKAKTQKI